MVFRGGVTDKVLRAVGIDTPRDEFAPDGYSEFDGPLHKHGFCIARITPRLLVIERSAETGTSARTLAKSVLGLCDAASADMGWAGIEVTYAEPDEDAFAPSVSTASALYASTPLLSPHVKDHLAGLATREGERGSLFSDSLLRRGAGQGRDAERERLGAAAHAIARAI